MSEQQSPSTRRWLRLGHLELSDLLVETFSVLLGVLLALAINAWVQARQTRHKVEEAQASIRGELQGDQRRLATMVEYYGQINGLLDAAAKSPKPPAYCDDLPQWKGLITPLLLHAAYDTTAGSGIFADMNFEETGRIAGLYAELARFESFDYKVEDWMVQQGIADHSLRFNATSCRGFLNDLEHSARRMQDDLDAYLQTAPGQP